MCCWLSPTEYLAFMGEAIAEANEGRYGDNGTFLRIDRVL
jgi:hypothetical protein